MKSLKNEDKKSKCFDKIRTTQQKDRYLPTLLDKNGFKFFFYANEHEPKHIHVMKNDDFAKIELDNLKVVQNYLKPKDLKFALEVVKEHKQEFERIWNEWFDKR
jgi:hypothetical protein